MEKANEQKIRSRARMRPQRLSKFCRLHGRLYQRVPNSVLFVCGTQEAPKLLDKAHKAVCGISYMSLYENCKRMVYYWPEMDNEAV